MKKRTERRPLLVSSLPHIESSLSVSQSVFSIPCLSVEEKHHKRQHASQNSESHTHIQIEERNYMCRTFLGAACISSGSISLPGSLSLTLSNHHNHHHHCLSGEKARLSGTYTDTHIQSVAHTDRWLSFCRSFRTHVTRYWPYTQESYPSSFPCSVDLRCCSFSIGLEAQVLVCISQKLHICCRRYTFESKWWGCTHAQGWRDSSRKRAAESVFLSLYPVFRKGREKEDHTGSEEMPIGFQAYGAHAVRISWGVSEVKRGEKSFAGSCYHYLQESWWLYYYYNDCLSLYLSVDDMPPSSSSLLAQRVETAKRNKEWVLTLECSFGPSFSLSTPHFWTQVVPLSLTK